MQFQQLIQEIQNLFPLDSALKDDVVGLQVNTKKNNIDSVLIAYEITKHVIDEAIEKKASLIICYHPLIFRPLQKIDFSDRISDLVSDLIRNDIALYCLHTCFDCYEKGSNYIVAQKLGLENFELIEKNEKYAGKGFGIIANTNKKIDLNVLVKKCEEIFSSPIRFNEFGKNKEIKRIAIIAGSGMSYYSKVESLNADAFITADVKYHDFHLADEKLNLIDPGHYEMEQFIVNGIFDVLKNKDFQVKLSKSNTYTNPVRYSNGDYKNMQIKNLTN